MPDGDTHATPDEDAYAADLLKDLLDDDDDDYQPDSISPKANRSLLNILNSSTSIEPVPVAVWTPSVTTPQVDSTPASSESFPKKAENSQVEATQSEEEDSEAAKTLKDLTAVDPPEPNNSIPMAQTIRLDDGEETRPTNESKPATSVSVPTGKRPPSPPPKPAPRILADTEILLTKEALNEMLPGGRNDEARDLAQLKFPDTNWYTQVFNEDYLRTLPANLPKQTLRESRFIIDRLGIQSGARVLDLCCGFGRHAIELSSKGFDLVGLDLSMVMLKKALADAQARGRAIKFVHGDMRKLAFKAIFDAIYNVQTSFGYFDDLSNFKVLQGVFNALKPGGVFLIETVNRDFIVENLPMRVWWKGVECQVLEEIDMEHISGLLKVQRSFVFEDTQRAPLEQKIQIRLYTAIEMRAMLMRAGFNVVELCGDYSLPNAYFGSASPRNIFIAEKPIR